MTVLLGCGDYTSGNSGIGTRTEASTGSAFASGGSGGGGSGGDGAAGGGSAGGAPMATTCDCGPSTCRTPVEVIEYECNDVAEDETATFAAWESCDYTRLTFSYDRGDRTEYYDTEGTLVFRHASNAFAGGTSVCGVKPACQGDESFVCRLCRGARFADDELEDCPATLWE